MASYEGLRAELVTRIETLSRRADNIEADLRKPGDRNWVERADGSREDFGATATVMLAAGDVFVIETPGGGGFGKVGG